MQEDDFRNYKFRSQSYREGDFRNQNLKQMMVIVQQKKKHFKKALSRINTTLKEPSHLNYLFNSSNYINPITPEQKEIIKDEHLARGSLSQVQVQESLDNKNFFNSQKQKNRRSLKTKSLNKVNPSKILKRYQTQASQQQTYQLKRSVLCGIAQQLYSITRDEQSKDKLRILIAQLKRNNKNSQKVQRIVDILKSCNPFFAKIDKVIGVCLFRIGEVYQLRHKKVLYDLNSFQSQFFIILDGQIKLKGPEGMHKICNSGQTLLQQRLFKEEFNGALEKATTVNQSLILQIKMLDYNKMLQDLYKFGYKQKIQELESILKQNYIIKNWLRNKCRRQYNS